jgi:hypothetical protein
MIHFLIMDGRKNNRGHLGKAGRKPKVEEEALIERLSPLDDTAFNALKKGIDDGHYWAVKLFFQYRYGRPKEIKDTHLFVDQPLFVSFKD